MSRTLIAKSILTIATLSVAVTFTLAAPKVSTVKPAPSAAAAKSTAPALPPDVPKNHPAAPAVESVVKKGIVPTKDDGDFHGAQPVTRYELAVILTRFIDYIESSRKPIKVTKRIVNDSDLSAVPSHWAYQNEHRLVEEGFIPVASPLLKKPGTEVVSAKDLAVIMATVTSRLSDRAMPVTPNVGPVD